MKHGPTSPPLARSPAPRGYSPAIRRFELSSIAAYVAVVAWLAVRVGAFVRGHPVLALAASFLGFLGADLVSGLVHWAADSWGSADLPVIGAGLIRPFREHHLDPQEITRHDFVETNGNNCFISLPVGLGAALLAGPGAGPLALFGAVFAGSLILWVFGTNQFHKWAHVDVPPAVVAWLQRARVILPPAHHDVHHGAPYASHYCITTGWMNGPLQALGVFRRSEALISRWTGALPRVDDLGPARTPAPSSPPEGLEDQDSDPLLLAG